MCRIFLSFEVGFCFELSWHTYRLQPIVCHLFTLIRNERMHNNIDADDMVTVRFGNICDVLSIIAIINVHLESIRTPLTDRLAALNEDVFQLLQIN